MEPKRIIFALAMLFGAAFLFFQVRKMASPSTSAQAPTVEEVNKVEYTPVLVATTEVPFGTRITGEHIGWKDWPTEALSAEFITKTNNPDALDNFVGGVNRSVIYAGEPISEKKIVISGSQGLMSSLLTSGMRAVAARISVDTAAGGFIQPGDYVDIILTTSVNQANVNGFGATEKMYAATTIFNNVRVLAIDQTYSSNSDSAEAAVIGSTATFEMTQSDAEFLQRAMAQGDLTLTLRPISGNRGASPSSNTRVPGSLKPGDTGADSGMISIYRYGQQEQVAVRGQ